MIVLAVSDLMFQPRILTAAEALGHETRVAESAAAFEEALSSASAAIIDLHDRSLDGMDAVAHAAAAGVRVLAFGRHTEPGLLRAARDAGARIVVPRSQLVEELPELIERVTRVETS